MKHLFDGRLPFAFCGNHGNQLCGKGQIAWSNLQVAAHCVANGDKGLGKVAFAFFERFGFAAIVRQLSG